MADVFLNSDIVRLTKNQKFLFIGDSNMRAIYKDFIWLSKEKSSRLIPESYLRTKLEKSFQGDNLIEASARTAGRDYKEIRDIYMESNDTRFTFCFVTRCYSFSLEERLKFWEVNFGNYPDVIVMNGALWDLSRWGRTCVTSYKDNILKLFQLLKEIFPPFTQVIWLTTSPISSKVKGALILPELNSIGESLRFSIVEANNYVAKVAANYGYDVLDLHGSMISQMHRQCSDGIHWHPDSIRMMVNMLLTHYSLSRDCKLPGRIDPDKSILLRYMIDAMKDATSNIVRKDRQVLKARRKLTEK